MRTCVVTTDLKIRPPGHVIVLNGACSSGKSTLARRLQHTPIVRFLLLSGDQLDEACVLPARRDTHGVTDALVQSVTTRALRILPDVS
jgi:chloramphenicol 3-O-phosphotransferase